MNKVPENLMIKSSGYLNNLGCDVVAFEDTTYIRHNLVLYLAKVVGMVKTYSQLVDPLTRKINDLYPQLFNDYDTVACEINHLVKSNPNNFIGKKVKIQSKDDTNFMYFFENAFGEIVSVNNSGKSMSIKFLISENKTEVIQPFNLYQITLLN